MFHAVEAISCEAAQANSVLEPLLALAPITFIFTSTGTRGGVGETGVNVARTNHHSSLLVVAILPPQSLLVLVHVLMLAPKVVPTLRLQPVLVVVLGFHLHRTVGEEVSLLATPEACM
jgi:hypothetical protein